jgi:UDPglucose 6-dehydrogenase
VAAPLLGPHVRLAEEPYAAAEGADALFLVTEWNEFRSPDYERLAQIMRGRLLLDGRNVWDAARARQAGFTYFGIGRPVA